MRRVAVVLALMIPAIAFGQAPHDHRMGGTTNPHAARQPVKPGQGAFAAIQEIVEILEADPATDWRKVNIDALREHLADMDNVTLHAEAKSEAVDGGMRFVVTGSGPVRDSIQRMVLAHARIMNGVGGWSYDATGTDGGASLTVKAPAKDAAELRALGFFGVMTRGMHHQAHHLMIARGGNPHH